MPKNEELLRKLVASGNNILLTENAQKYGWTEQDLIDALAEEWYSHIDQMEW